MSWRCGQRKNAFACMRAPDHAGDHQTAIMINGSMGLVFWSREDDVRDVEPMLSTDDLLLPELVAEVTPSFDELVTEMGYDAADFVPPPRADAWTWGRHDRVGKRRTPETLNNLYAGCNEGVHTNWNLFGHEIARHQTLDEIELDRSAM